MNAIDSQGPRTLTVTHVLAELLERLDRSAEPVGADQYRSVAQHLMRELSGLQSDFALQALLDTHPAAAELYENVNYQHAGLCKSSLDAAVNSEMQARAVIARAKSQTGGDQPV
jgi:hypothetical protein